MLFFSCLVVLFCVFDPAVSVDGPVSYGILTRENPVDPPATNGLDPNTTYCYHYTWMGRYYDNATFIQIQNKTCNDFFSLLKEKPLCADPMVATDNGREPDLNKMMQKYRDKVLCKLSPDQVCAKYTWYYNGVVANETRYCTRINVDGESSMESGCVSEPRGPYTVEACACKSDKGRYPCNKGPAVVPPSLLLLLLLLLPWGSATL